MRMMVSRWWQLFAAVDIDGSHILYLVRHRVR